MSTADSDPVTIEIIPTYPLEILDGVRALRLHRLRCEQKVGECASCKAWDQLRVIACAEGIRS